MTAAPSAMWFFSGPSEAPRLVVIIDGVRVEKPVDLPWLLKQIADMSQRAAWLAATKDVPPLT
jgi:hypothetical protein